MKPAAPQRPACFSNRVLALIELRDSILDAIRAFFRANGYCEVTTPLLVHCPGLDRHVEALPAGNGQFLATSPELHMKRLVCRGAPRIFQISPAFRADEQGAQHTREFLMLEWYRTGSGYREMMQETEELLRHVTGCCSLMPAGLSFPVPRITVDQLYERSAGWQPTRHWDEDRYFRDWAATVEPYLQTQPALIVHDFPAALAALSRISTENFRICERFELFLNGLEICNAYSELTDPDEHRVRFDQAARCRAAMGRPPYEADEPFLQAVASGMPACAGNALGLDRLIMALTGASHISDVHLFPEDLQPSP